MGHVCVRSRVTTFTSVITGVTDNPLSGKYHPSLGRGEGEENLSPSVICFVFCCHTAKLGFEPRSV